MNQIPFTSPRTFRSRRERALDALPTRSSPTRAFVSTFVPGTLEQCTAVREAASAASVHGADLRKAERFLVHILSSATRDGTGFVPVPSKLIEREFRSLDWRRLEEAGIVRVQSYDRHAGRCREFGVPATVSTTYYEAGPTAARLADGGLYDLTTGRATRRRIKSDRRTPNGNPLPPLIRAAIDAVAEVPIDVHAIERHLSKLRSAADIAEEGAGQITAYGRYMNDLRCHQAVLTQGARPQDPARPNGLWIYQPAYRPQRFGRISQKGGGLQSCSSAMKAVAYPEAYP